MNAFEEKTQQNCGGNRAADAGLCVFLRRLETSDLAAVAAVERACFSEPWSEQLLAELPDSPYDETWVLVTDGEPGDGKFDECGVRHENTTGSRHESTVGGRETRPAGTTGEELVGYISYRFLAGEGELMRIAVLPRFRGRGYSRKLMEKMEKSAIEQGIAVLTLEVREGNTPARKLYESRGFSQIAARKDYYRHPTENAVVMQRRNLLVIST